MADNLWFILVALGPVILGGAIAYALMKRRRLTGAEKAQQHEAVERLYDKPQSGR
jgi:hypothetical protein